MQVQYMLTRHVCLIVILCLVTKRLNECCMISYKCIATFTAKMTSQSCDCDPLYAFTGHLVFDLSVRPSVHAYMRACFAEAFSDQLAVDLLFIFGILYFVLGESRSFFQTWSSY